MSQRRCRRCPADPRRLDAALAALDREHHRVRTAVTALLAGTAG